MCLPTSNKADFHTVWVFYDANYDAKVRFHPIDCIYAVDSRKKIYDVKKHHSKLRDLEKVWN